MRYSDPLMRLRDYCRLRGQIGWLFR